MELRLQVLIFRNLRFENVIKTFLIYMAYGNYIVNIEKRKCPQLFWSIHLLDYSLPLFILLSFKKQKIANKGN